MSKKRIVILGGGESGVGAALLAKKNEFDVFLSDFGQIEKSYRKELKDNKIDFEESGHDFERIVKADLVVKSPGIPETAKIIQKLRTNEVPIISEIEFGSRYYVGKIIAITGSNGKTTTTGLVYHLLSKAGLNVLVGGNYGVSFCRQIMVDPKEYAVLEISSFQLDDIHDFQPEIAVILNITADHLDRYDYDINKYAESKFRIAENQKNNNLLIVNKDDELTQKILDRNRKGQRVFQVERDNYLDGISSKEGVFKLKLKGEHNLFNTYCSVLIARELGVTDDEIQHGLLTFENAPHRLESVGIIDGVEYINDSKATNVDACFYALKAIDQNVIWIAGGVDKGNDYSSLFSLIDKVKVLICLGVNNQKLIEVFSGKVDVITTASNMIEAIRKARMYSLRNEVVLLAPACASFDLFKNYIDRGDQFRSEVKKYLKK